MMPYYIPPPNKCPLCGGHFGYRTETCSFKKRDFWAGLDRIKNVDQRMKAVESLYDGRLINDYQLWDVLSDYYSPFSPRHAKMVYENLGLVPFGGYPLTKDKNPKKDRQAAFDAEKESNDAS